MSKLKCIKAHIKTLEEFQSHIFEEGHTFWYCDMQDKERSRPFYYYQINRSKNMCTCSNCYELMRLRREIRKLQKEVNIELTPLRYKFTNDDQEKRIMVTRGGINNDYAAFGG